MAIKKYTKSWVRRHGEVDMESLGKGGEYDESVCENIEELIFKKK